MAARRFLNGLSSVAGTDPLAHLPYLDPTKYSIYYQDWFSPHFGAALANGNATYDGLYYLSDSANATIDVAPSAYGNGILTITMTATDNIAGGCFTLAPSMRLRSGKKFFLSTRFQFSVSPVSQAELFIGLCSEATTPAHTDFFNAAGNVLEVDDAVGFAILDGSATVKYVCRENDVGDYGSIQEIDKNLGNFNLDTNWAEAAIYYDGTDIEFRIQRVPLGGPHMVWDDIRGARKRVSSPTIPVSPVGFNLSLKNGAAEAKIMRTDYFFAACER